MRTPSAAAPTDQQMDRRIYVCHCGLLRITTEQTPAGPCPICVALIAQGRNGIEPLA